MLAKSIFALPLVAALGAAGVSLTARDSINPDDFDFKGLVAIGQFPASLKDSNGETIGGIGSAAGLVPSKFTRKGKKYSGQLFLQPDRGYNVEETIDYVARHHTFDFEFQEYTGKDDLKFADAVKRFNLTYKESLFYHEAIADSRKTTGLNPTLVRTGGLSGSDSGAKPLPAANGSKDNVKQKISFDTEGFVANPDGTFYVSEEYGPYIYKVAADGTIISYITPPEAVIPRTGGQVNFTAEADGDSGRSPNQGFEGLTSSFDGKSLYAVLQGGLIQDGGEGAKYLRVFQFDVSALASVTTPSKLSRSPGAQAKLVGEWVVEVPTSKKGKARGVSDIIYLGKDTLALLVRDGNGFGDDETDASYKHVDVISLSGATNIAGTNYDSATGAVAPGGTLASGIKTAKYTQLIDYLEDLPRFGMHAADEPVDQTLIAAKIESLVLLPTLPDGKNDKKFDKDEFFILSVSDNDFQTKNGFMQALGPYSAEYPVDVPTQIFVFKVKLPGVDRSDLLNRLNL